MRLFYKGKFDAAHRLNDATQCEEWNKKAFGKCNTLHGHTWVIEFELDGEPKRDGMVVNFVELKALINFFDHGYINDIVNFLPTAENLAVFFIDKLREKDLFTYIKVRVWESDHAYAEEEWRCR